MPSASSRSAAPTSSRCTSAAIPSSGCGCTAAGAKLILPLRMLPSTNSNFEPNLNTNREARSMKSEQRVLLFAPNWLGDAVMALPAMADVRRHFGGARVIVAARDSVAALYAMAPCVDEVVRADAEPIRAVGAGTAILFPNSFASARLAQQAAVPERWGYASDLRGRLLTRAVRKPRRSMHQGAYYQHLVQALGIDNGPLEPRLDVPAAVSEQARALLTKHGWDGKRRLVVVAPGAAYGTAKRWLPAHFARLVKLVADAR